MRNVRASVPVARRRRGEQTSRLSCARAGTDEGERGVSVVRERMGVSRVRVVLFVPESRFQATLGNRLAA